ncbi:cytidylate kinase [Streptococcus vestibularis F0396]|uniref:Cytidylate kinase n=1 Tax=Streptococcus vestibularis F0396 TaxID=904306 RepID=E3CP41_STRVE|nr:cytidylate kinase [Streptococcus vestibularis F0396]
MKDIRIAIDGPASSGKSTVAKIIAKNLGYTYLDTGAMYRSATYLALQNGLTEENVPEILEQLSQHPISFGKAADGSQQVYVGDVDITHPIRDNQVTNNVSWVAAIPEVRQELVAQQQRIAQDGAIIMDGRDIGTVVLPDAELKIFLIASVDERAERRYKENIEKGISTDLETLKKKLLNVTIKIVIVRYHLLNQRKMPLLLTLQECQLRVLWNLFKKKQKNY